jgi:hypothetical protein
MPGLDLAALAALASTAAVGAGLLIHVVRYAYGQGRFEQRLRALENGQSEIGQAQRLTAALTATVSGLKDSVDGLHEAVSEIRRHLFHVREP